MQNLGPIHQLQFLFFFDDFSQTVGSSGIAPIHCNSGSEQVGDSFERPSNLLAGAKWFIYVNCIDHFGVANISLKGVNCLKLANDVMKIASPYCPTPEELSGFGEAANHCSMGEEYFVSRVMRNTDFYQGLIQKIKNNLTKVAAGPVPETYSIWKIVLESCEGDKDLAIFMMNMDRLGIEGLRGLTRKFEQAGANENLLDLLSSLGNGYGEFLAYEIYKRPDHALISSDLTTLPPEVNGVPEQKSYHFWPRAVLASELSNRGHSDEVSTWAAIFSQEVYEYSFGLVNVAVKNPDGLPQSLEWAEKDIEIASQAAEFALSDE